MFGFISSIQSNFEDLCNYINRDDCPVGCGETGETVYYDNLEIIKTALECYCHPGNLQDAIEFGQANDLNMTTIIEVIINSNNWFTREILERHRNGVLKWAWPSTSVDDVTAIEFNRRIKIRISQLDSIIKIIADYKDYNSKYMHLIDEFKQLQSDLIDASKVYDFYIELVMNNKFKEAAEYAIKQNWYKEAFEMYKKIGDIDNAYKCKVIMMEK